MKQQPSARSQIVVDFPHGQRTQPGAITDAIIQSLLNLLVSLRRAGIAPSPQQRQALMESIESWGGEGETTTAVVDEPLSPSLELVTQAEAARRIGLTRAAISRWVKAGKLRVYRPKMESKNPALVSMQEVFEVLAASLRS